MQNLRAIREQRRTALTQVQAPAIEFRQVCNEVCRRLALVSRQVLHLREKFCVGKPYAPAPAL
jgi:hypothetical protein